MSLIPPRRPTPADVADKVAKAMRKLRTQAARGEAGVVKELGILEVPDLDRTIGRAPRGERVAVVLGDEGASVLLASEASA